MSRFYVDLSGDAKEALRYLAKSQDRSASNYLRRLICSHLESTLTKEDRARLGMQAVVFTDGAVGQGARAVVQTVWSSEAAGMVSPQREDEGGEGAAL